MKIKKSTIQGIAQYLCDINEFGFEDENIDSMELWADKAESLMYELQENDDSHLISISKVDKAIDKVLKDGIPRDILFKAKRVDNGEWVKGWLCQNHYPLGRYELAIQLKNSYKKYDIVEETVKQIK